MTEEEKAAPWAVIGSRIFDNAANTWTECKHFTAVWCSLSGEVHMFWYMDASSTT